jgi:hypothetical protein
MQNKTTLIIPDVHHKWAIAEKIIALVPHDEVIFIGDYFDDFNDTPQMVWATCDWLARSVEKPNRTHLFGNHDVHYAFPHRTFQCSGFAPWKNLTIQDRVSRKVWDKLKWYHILDDTWLLTHAGLHKRNLPKDIQALHKDRKAFLKAIGEYLDVELVAGMRSAANNKPHWVFNAGKCRGGVVPVGGITWCDFVREFHPIKGLHQIVGHTAQQNEIPNWCIMNEQETVTDHPCHLFTPLEFDNTELSFNVDLDVWGNLHYAVWDGKTLSVKSNESL